MFKFIKKLFSSKPERLRKRRGPKASEKTVIKEESKIYDSTEEMEKPALTYVKTMDLTERQAERIKHYVRYRTDYEFNYQYRLPEFIQDVKDRTIENNVKGFGKKTTEKLLNQMRQDGLI